MDRRRRANVRCVWVLVPLLGALCGCPTPMTITAETSAVRCECGCNIGPIHVTRSVKLCIDRDIQPSGATFTEDELVEICDGVCSGGVQAQAQESLMYDQIIDDPCIVSCERAGLPEAFDEPQCVDPDSNERMDCVPDRCPSDMPGDLERMRNYLMACTQVVDDSRPDPSACGPDRPTAPVCLVDDEDEEVPPLIW